MRREFLAAAVAWSLVLSCGTVTRVGAGPKTPVAVQPAGTAARTNTVVATAPPAPSLPPGAAPLVERARLNLQTRKAVSSAGDVHVLSVQPMEWADPSLECPDPEYRFAPRPTPGFRIDLQAAGRTYEYHTDRGYSIVLCADGRPVGGYQR